MVVGPVDHRHVGGPPSQRPECEQAPEPASDDDDTMARGIVTGLG